MLLTGRQAHADHHAVCPKQSQISIVIVCGGNSIDYKIKMIGKLFHFLVVARDNEVMSAKALCVLLLRARTAEYGDFCFKRGTKFHRHVTKPAEAEHAKLVSLADFPITERRICGDART